MDVVVGAAAAHGPTHAHTADTASHSTMWGQFNAPMGMSRAHSGQLQTRSTSTSRMGTHEQAAHGRERCANAPTPDRTLALAVAHYNFSLASTTSAVDCRAPRQARGQHRESRRRDRESSHLWPTTPPCRPCCRTSRRQRTRGAPAMAAEEKPPRRRVRATARTTAACDAQGWSWIWRRRDASAFLYPRPSSGGPGDVCSHSRALYV